MRPSRSMCSSMVSPRSLVARTSRCFLRARGLHRHSGALQQRLDLHFIHHRRRALAGARAGAASRRARFVGELVDVELKSPKRDEPAQAVYEVKLLTAQGDLIKVRIDATSGALLEADGEDLARARRPARARRGDAHPLPGARRARLETDRRSAGPSPPRAQTPLA